MSGAHAKSSYLLDEESTVFIRYLFWGGGAAAESDEFEDGVFAEGVLMVSQ